MSFTSNYLKLRAEREGKTTNNAGGATPPATSQAKPSGSDTDSFTSNYLALREKRNNMTISERVDMKAQTLQKKQQEQRSTKDGVLKDFLQNRKGPKTSGGYYSRPALGAQNEQLYGNITALEPALTEKRSTLDTAATALTQAEKNLKVVQGQLMNARSAYDANPTTEAANSYNQIVGAYNLAYDAYASAFKTYSSAYDAYKPYEDQMVDALAAYQVYTGRQQTEFDKWRSTIRDEATIRREMETIDQQIEAMEQQKLAAYQAQRDEKPWYEKLAGYLGEVQDTTLPTAGMAPGAGPEAVDPEVQKLLAARKLLQEELDWSRYYHYADFAGAADFGEKSKYIPQQRKEQRTTDIMMGNYSADASGWEDPLYEYVNGNEEAGAFISNAAARSYGPDNAIGAIFGRATESKTESQEMTEQEVATFNYLYATQGKEAAHEYYYGYLQADLNRRHREAQEEKWAEYAKKNPLGASVFSVAVSPAKGLSYIGQLTDIIQDGKIDENAAYNKFSYIPGTIRKTVPENWGPVGTFAYQTGMSMADFLLASALTGNTQTVTLAIMGSGAAADTVMAAKDRGLNDDQAFTLGTIAGIAEAAMESVNMETVFNPNLLRESILKYILKNGASEGMEEVGTDVVNLIADILISKDQSEWQISIDNYKKQGMTESEAIARALGDQALVMVSDFAGGFLSGSIMSGVTALVNRTNTQKLGNELDELDLDEEDVRAFIESGLESDPDSDAYFLAKQMQEKIDAGEKLSNYDLARLYQANVQEQPEAGWNDRAEAEEGREPEGLQLPTLDNATQEGNAVTAGDRNVTQNQGNDTAQPAGVPLSIAEQLRQEEAKNGGAQYESTQRTAAGPATAQPAGANRFPVGTGVFDGGSQWHDGESTGEQTGVLAGRARQAAPGDQARVDAARASVQRTNIGKNLRTEKVSSTDLGLQNGTETKHLQIIPEEYWDDSMAAKAEQVHQETGRQVTYILGRMQVRDAKGNIFYAKGADTGDRIIVQANNTQYTAEQIADHEAYHGMADPKNYGQLLSDGIVEQIKNTFSREEFDQVLRKYIDALSGIYDLRSARDGAEYEQRMNGIIEELLADAHAGMNMWGAGATKFTDTVNRFLDDNNISRKPEQDNGTEAPTGPPEERFSYEDKGALSLPTLEDEAASDYEGRSLINDPEIYTYDFLTAQPDMNPVALPEVASVKDASGKIDAANVVENGMKNALSVGLERDGKTYVKNRYTGREVWVTTSAIRHGLNGAANRLLTNARLGSVIGDIVQNAIPINALHNTADGVDGTYAMAAYAHDEQGREFVAIVTVEQRTNTVADISAYDMTHAISGRQKRSKQVDTKSQGINPSMLASEEGSQADTKSQGFNLIKASSKISIADMLTAVKEAYQSILSNDVLDHMGETRNPKGHYTGRVRYSYAGENANNADLDALARAKEMRSAGVADETIRQQTGWHTGMDGKWRWEIDDSTMRYDSSGDLRGAESAKWAMEDYESARDDLWGHADMDTLDKVRAYNRADIAHDDTAKQDLYDELINGPHAYYFNQYVEAMDRAKGARNAPAGGTLQDYIDHTALFEAYPQLRNVTLRFERMGGGMMGHYDRHSNEIVLNTELRYAAEDTLVHEIQHAIQKAEGFARGSNVDYWQQRQDGDDAVHVYDAKIQESEKKMDEIMRQLPENVAEQFRRWSSLDESSQEAMMLMQELGQGPYGDLFNEYFMITWGLDEMRSYNHKRGPNDLYRNTAGEIEARDVTARRSLTLEQRRSQEPARRDANTVFMEDSDELSLQMGDRYSADDTQTYAEIQERQQELRQRELDLQERKREATNNPELLQAMDEYSSLFTEMRGLLPKRRNGTATQAELDRIEEIKTLRDEYMQRISDLQESLGLAAISQEETEIREEKEALRVASDAAWAREGAERENLAIAKAGVSPSEYFRRKAVKAFKTTTNFNEAGYLLPDGKLLNFSGGERNHRYRDHREIGEIYEATNGVAALNRFLADGNIRIMAESPGADLPAGVEPTREQYAALRKFINSNGMQDGRFYVDFSNADGSRAGNYVYEGRIYADRVLNDIKHYYTTGETVQRMDLNQFRYSVDDEGSQQSQEQKPAAPKKKIRPVAESRPLIAKKDLRSTVLNLFSIPNGQRAEVGAMIDSYADRLIKNGSLTEDDRKAFFDRMYDSGVMVMPADEYSAYARSHIEDGRIYVSDSVKSDFGDDWADIRRRAFAAGVYLVNDRSASGIDQWNATLSAEDMLPGLFDSEETDERTILERILQVAEEGKDEHLSLAEYTRRLSQQEGISEDEFLDNMERQLDWALRTFAEKASLEVHLRDRTGQKIAQEREKGAERMTRQKAKEAQRRADERQARKDSARRAKERRELRELQQRTLKQMQWLSKNRFRAPEELQATWDEVLGDIDIYAISAADEMRWSDKHNATWKDLAQMYKDAMKNDPNFLPSKELERIVTRLDATKIADMDLGALQDLYKAAIGLRTEFYNRNNVINDEMQRLFAEVYTDAKREIESAPGENSAKKGKVSGWADKFLNMDQLTPMNVLQRMGGWDPDGAFYSMAKQLERGERDMRAYSVKAQKMLQDFLTEHEDWVKKADGQGKDGFWYKIEIPELVALELGKTPKFGDTIEVWMTPMQKIHMYLESKNQDNLRHMTGGRTFANKQLYSEGKRQEAFAQGKTVRMAPETVKVIVKDLTAEEMELAQILDRYYNTFATQEINRVSNILYGYDKAMGKNYAPIYTNRNYTKTEFGVFDTTAEGVGNLKGRQYAVNPSYNISAFDAFERHVDQTARFCGMAIPARNWTTLMNWREKNNSTGDVITHKWGEESKRYITDLITTLQAGDDAKSDTISSGLSKLQSNYITAIFGANPSIVLKQLGSIPLAGAYLDARNMPTPAQISKIDRSLISTYTQELEWRTMGYATPETKQLKDNPNWTQTNKVFKFVFGGGAITAMDGWAASTLWPWAENKVRREHPELDVGTKAQIDAGESAFYKKVAEEFEIAVSRSQSVSDEIHQGTLRKSKNPITKAFTMFRSDSAQTYNALRQKIGEAQFYARTGAKDKVQADSKKAVGAVVCALLMNTVWSEAVSFLMALWKNKSKYYRDDEDELTAESVIGEMGRNMMESIMGTVTFGDEIAQLIGNAITGDRRYDLEAPGLEQINEIFDLVQDMLQGNFGRISEAADVVKNGGNLGEYLSDNSGEILGEIKDTATKVATYFGLPVNNVEAYLLGALKWVSPELGTAYDDLFQSIGKSDLAGMEGDALEGRVGRILSDRNVSESDDTAAALAALYEAGYKTAIPSDTPTSVSIDGEKHSLGEYQQQAYDTIWGGIVADALDDIVSSDLFTGLDQKTQADMLKRLYDYATDTAKAELFDCDTESGTQTIDELKAAGLDLADCIGWASATSHMKNAEKYAELLEWDMSDKAKQAVVGTIIGTDLETESGRMSEYARMQQALKEGLSMDEYLRMRLDGADTEDFLELTDGGVDDNLAYDFVVEMNQAERTAGEEGLENIDRWRVCVDFSSDVEDQLTALSMIMEPKALAVWETANNYGVAPDVYVTFQEIGTQYDANGNGSYTQAEAKAAIDAEFSHLSTAQKAVLWQWICYSSGSKKNPYDPTVGQNFIDSRDAAKAAAEE